MIQTLGDLIIQVFKLRINLDSSKQNMIGKS